MDGRVLVLVPQSNYRAALTLCGKPAHGNSFTFKSSCKNSTVADGGVTPKPTPMVARSLPANWCAAPPTVARFPQAPCRKRSLRLKRCSAADTKAQSLVTDLRSDGSPDKKNGAPNAYYPADFIHAANPPPVVAMRFQAVSLGAIGILGRSIVRSDPFWTYCSTLHTSFTILSFRIPKQCLSVLRRASMPARQL